MWILLCFRFYGILRVRSPIFFLIGQCCAYTVSRLQFTLKDTAFNTTAPTGFDSFLGTFSVPHIPRRVAHIVYLFTGLQNIDWYAYWRTHFPFTNVGLSKA